MNIYNRKMEENTGGCRFPLGSNKTNQQGVTEDQIIEYIDPMFTGVSNQCVSLPAYTAAVREGMTAGAGGKWLMNRMNRPRNTEIRSTIKTEERK